MPEGINAKCKWVAFLDAFGRSKEPLHNLAVCWEEPAELFAEQERDWHEVVLFCQKIKKELKKKKNTAISADA